MEGISSSTASWIQAGGVVAFGALVLVILRQLKPVLDAVQVTLMDVGRTMAALLERERVRGERIAAADAQRRQQLAILEADFDDPPTNPIAMRVPKSALRTPSHGVPVGRYGPMKPGDGDGG
jgi:hypothetical protein